MAFGGEKKLSLFQTPDKAIFSHECVLWRACSGLGVCLTSGEALPPPPIFEETTLK